MGLFDKKSYKVSRTKKISAPLDKILSKVRDLKKWNEWNPWIIHEPDCKLTYSENPDSVGGWYEWDGKYIGSGRMTNVSFDDNGLTKLRLNFLRPMKSVCDVVWSFSEKDGKTEATWDMYGEMPWFFSWMAKKMDSFVGPDYELGLELLNTLVSDDKNDTLSLELKGNVKNPTGKYLTVDYEGKLSEIQSFFSKAFEEIYEKGGDKIDNNQPAIAIYFKVDPTKDYIKCKAGGPIQSTEGLNESEIFEISESWNCATLDLHGGYDFLHLAWRALFGNIKMRKRKIRKGMYFEYYLTPPSDVKKDQITRLMVPLR